MKDFRASDWFTIAGRGRVAAVSTEGMDGPVRVDERVRIDGDEYIVRGIEMARVLTYPPVDLPTIGLLVTRAPQSGLGQP